MKKLMQIFLVLILFISLPLTTNAHVLDQAVTKNLGKSNTSVSLRSLTTGNILYEHNGQALMKPASTLKLLTGSAALHVLGKDYTFTTDLYIDGDIIDGILYGDVYIKGGGDPTLQQQDFLTFAKVLKRYGIRQVQGHLYGDDSAFSGSVLTPGIVKQDETEYYAARISALTMSPNADYDAGTVIVQVTGNTVKKAPSFTVLPNTSGMKFVNQARTGAKTSKNTLSVKRQYGSSTVVITGNIPQGSTVKKWVTLQDPTMNTLHAIRTTWQTAALNVTNPSVGRKIVPATARKIYTKESLPLHKLYPVFMKLSNNSIADILVKTMGREVHGIGTTENGVAVLRDYVASLGLNVSQWRFEDGSGMSHVNRVSANELTALLTTMQQQAMYSSFYQGLPIGGQPSRLVGGSLRTRFDTNVLRGRVVAKTGSITNVYTLSGYVTAKSGRQYAFAIMTDHKNAQAIKQIDRLVESIIQNY
ncbi:D-alanyl-D-alanine carboxypeptidase/D-alanyl-D-alanine-endopeptidase [Metasolibacillus sp.]|uniref:D-alanyl-D-alanine carboxypeptidase/D-alanyl-D-alanine endopeptidase n=1 Tax=Metasolibacillus sp. TaxID=2703680 RepID=UPI0025E84155|nr:D-alanyl-D-alanine carboxypeptidase/D-alanyl-D-alanine-endopeptidase [Metasolibacillus sp.]MCT6922582.1 D-alanyl-D-alanine carboxypeptidase/D-alanyl-D-alanine-endopeptidase [Metasolibacillus sp.]MCT6939079.1 D-alanyl-D-alanine carboxypeptidase/D-alanyl-D-alanine-endopeptidase [Metasolibacillus sp.]